VIDVKNKRYLIFVLAAVFLFACLTGCGKGKPAQTEEPSPAQTEPAGTDGIDTSSEPEEPEPEVWPRETTYGSLSQLYSPVSENDLYQLNIAEIEGWIVDWAQLQGDYVLLWLREPLTESDEPEPDPDREPVDGEDNEDPGEWLNQTGTRLLQFHLADSANPRVIENPDIASVFTMLPDGSVLECNQEQHRVVRYKAGLDQFTELPISNASFVGINNTGGLWFWNGDSQALTLLVNDEIVFETTVSDVIWVQEYLSQISGQALFLASDSSYETCVLSVSVIDKTSELKTDLLRTPSLCGEKFLYFGEHTWYLAEPENPNEITCFGKISDGDYLWKADEKFGISEQYIYHEETENSDHTATVLDVTNGGVVTSLERSDIPGGGSFTLLDYSAERLLISAGEWNEPNALYLWDLGGKSAEIGAADYRVVDFSQDESVLAVQAKEILDTWGITVIYDEFSLAEYNYDRTLIPCEDEAQLGRAMIALQSCLAEYPEGFFEDIVYDLSGIRIYLCGGYEASFLDTLANPAATANTGFEYLCISYDVNYWDNMRGFLCHELMHLMEYRIGQYGIAQDTDSYETWLQVLNSSDYPYLDSYGDYDNTTEMEGTVAYGDADAWYIDSYARVNILEDRARTLEYMIRESEPWWFSSSHMMDKANYLASVIREVFPSVAACSEPVMWEALTGIVPFNGL